MVGRLWQVDLCGEALFAKVASGKLVRVREKVKRAVLYVIVFQVVHHVRAVAFHLFVARDRAEDDLGEALRGKHVKTDATNHTVVFDKS